MSEKATQGNRSIEKAFQIIEAMAHYQKAMRLQDIATACKMPSSTVLRMLATMQKCGYVQQDNDTQRYFLTVKFCHLSNLVSWQISIRNTVHPQLIELAQAVGEYTTIAIERDMVLYYIDEINPLTYTTALRIMEGVGRTAMLHCNGIGKLFLSEFDEKRLDYYIGKFGLPRMTANTLTTKATLSANLALIRERGFSIDDEENEIGVRSIATPVKDRAGNIICGLSVACPSPRYSVERLMELAPLLTAVAESISKQYFCE